MEHRLRTIDARTVSSRDNRTTGAYDIESSTGFQTARLLDYRSRLREKPQP